MGDKPIEAVLDTAMDGISDLLCEIDEKNDEIERLRADIERLTNNPADYRYWEGRYRDEAADNERLRAALTRLVSWAGPVELACPELGGLLKAMYDARAALKEGKDDL